jgi:5-methylcytosine-specific restriction protein B
MDEALSVTLPYSKQSFSVPDNIYLIGTMNTADRSLASLDIALRRRFEFVEMPPRPDFLNGLLINGIDIGELLRIMNARIEVLLGREHCLGHAYFMALLENPSIDVLAEIFRLQIIPLLQEYFFEDWQRISWVLNDHRKLDENRFLTQPKTDLLKLFGDEDGVRLNSNRWHVNALAFDRIEAYAGVIDHELKVIPLDVRREIEFDGYTITQLKNGSIRITGVEEGSVLGKLREIADQLQITTLNGKGNVCNNIELGAKIIKTIDAQNAVVAPQSAMSRQA